MNTISTKVTEASMSLFSGSYCCRKKFIDALTQETGFKPVRDRDLVDAAMSMSGLPESTITRAFSSKSSVFDKFTHEKNRALAYIRLALADILETPRVLISGFSAHLVPQNINHVLRTCLIADLPFRIKQGMQGKLKETEVLRRIEYTDAEKLSWTSFLFKNSKPWDSALYNILLPMHQLKISDVVNLVVNHLGMEELQPTNTSRQAVSDFQLAARATVALVRAGHDGLVTAKKGELKVLIGMKVLMFNRLQDELKTVLSSLPGVKSVIVEIDPSARQANVYRKFDFSNPSKVLLVDDEQEFVQTLSDRLIFRNFGTAIAYDGKSALEMLIDDDPDVLVLDLKMPGIDGIEVLRRVKKIRPHVEVIILTGHGSEADRQTCTGLGAFAYMHKPVDIDVLSSKLKEAHEKVRFRKYDT